MHASVVVMFQQDAKLGLHYAERTVILVGSRISYVVCAEPCLI
jgi:hypothetical protein